VLSDEQSDESLLWNPQPHPLHCYLPPWSTGRREYTDKGGQATWTKRDGWLA
jgi:hypothetical protein